MPDIREKPSTGALADPTGYQGLPQAQDYSATSGTLPDTSLGQAGMTDYWWNNPSAALDNLIAQVYGGTPNVNSQFYQSLQNLVPGLQWAQLLGNAGNPTGAESNWMGALGSWLGAPANSGGGTGFGGLGNLNNLLGTLLNQGNGDAVLAAYLDQLSPNNLAQGAGQLIQSLGYGTIAPQLMTGVASLLSQALTNFNAQGLGANDPLHASSLFLNYLKNNSGGLLDWLGM